MNDISYIFFGLVQSLIGLVFIVFSLLILFLILAFLYSEFFSSSNEKNYMKALSLFQKDFLDSQILNSIEYLLSGVRKKIIYKDDYYERANLLLSYVKIINFLPNYRLPLKEGIAHCLSKTRYNEYLNTFRKRELDLLNQGIIYLYKCFKDKNWKNKNHLKAVQFWESKGFIYDADKYFPHLKENLKNNIYLYQKKERKFSTDKNYLLNFQYDFDFIDFWKIHWILLEIEISKQIEMRMKNLNEIKNFISIKELIEIKEVIIHEITKNIADKISSPLTIIDNNFFNNFKNKPITHISGSNVELLIPKQNFKTYLSSNDTNKTTNLTGYLREEKKDIQMINISFLSMKNESYNMKLIQYLDSTVREIHICMSPYQYDSYFNGENADTDIKDTLFLFPNKNIFEYSTVHLRIENNLQNPPLEFGKNSQTHNIISFKYSSKLLK